MNPIDVTQRLKDAFIRYLLTTFDVNRDGENELLYGAMRSAFEADSVLVTGPFLELALPYQLGTSIKNLVEEGLLSQKILGLPNPPIPVRASLYQHQENAIRRIIDGHNIIVSSGTGSGKTESFMIPILNDLLQNPAKGVRAILIYPLNALVNDQLDRLGKLLQGTNITYGRYTSELAQTTEEWKKATGKSEVPVQQIISREQIRNKEKIPNILITNYAMLEYLLLRPNEYPLFQHPGDWKYIVLDEAHSYTGAKGIEVAYLLRRLKHHVGKARGEMTCIGTSATLTNEPAEAIKFAETLFGESFETDDIIFGQSVYEEIHEAVHEPNIEAYLDIEWAALLKGLRDNTATVKDVLDRLSKFGLVGKSVNLETDSVPTLLYRVLKHNAHLRELRSLMMSQPDVPLGVKDAARKVFLSGESRPDFVQEQDAVKALNHLIELGAIARPHPDQATLLPARYHLFARSPQGLWACLNPDCTGRPEGHPERWSRLFGSPRLECDSCGCAVFPLSVCRNCGQVYVKTIYADSQYWAEPRQQANETTRYFVWKSQDFNEALADPTNEEDEAGGKSSENSTLIDSRSTTICVNPGCRRDSRCSCARDGRTPHHVMLYNIIKQVSGKSGVKPESVPLLTCCARCGSESRIAGEEVATPVAIRGMTPLSVLTMELYRHLPEAPDTTQKTRPGNGRKLLSFYDSRQGAARYAAFLQDVFNQDLLRYLVPQALRVLSAAHDSIDLTQLAEQATFIGWNDLRVFQNTVDNAIDELFDGSEYRRKSWEGLSRSERQRLQDFIKAQILAEITTNRRSRQSLESLGLVRLRYFEDEDKSNVATLAHRLALPPEHMLVLINNLLDTLRNQKNVTLPSSIGRDHPAFGNNRWNDAVVRSGRGEGQSPWVGQSVQQARYRIMEQALQAANRKSDQPTVQKALLDVWEWLTEPALGLMSGDDAGRYRLSTSHLFFDSPEDNWYQCTKCQRLRHGPSTLPCPAPRCGGIYEPINRSDRLEKNYYYYIFQQGLKPMRVEEHTAQLDPKKAQDYQREFKDGKINVLSCSTTFEMGIDLGDLQAVMMNNVPPNVSNYRQRAGRAGRRAAGTAFIVTWAVDRPHDQHYFDTPPEIIRGQVRIPCLTLDNREIRRRHLNALLLGEFLRFLHQQGAGELDKMGAFFDVQAMNERHYNQRDKWRQESRNTLTQKLSDFAPLIGYSSIDTDDALHTFFMDLSKSEEIYHRSSTLYREQITHAKDQYMKTSGRQADEWDKQRKEAEHRLDRLSRNPLIDTLSSGGALPSYSFPLYTVELELPIQKKDTAQLRLQRDLRRAITEFAPGAEIVADKRLWKSSGVVIRQNAPQIFDYRLCQECNHILAEETSGVPLKVENCPVCGTSYKGKHATTRYIVPDGFSTDPNSGKMAGQYVHYETGQPAVAVFIPTTRRNEQANAFVDRRVQTDARLFYLQDGEMGLGYKLCNKCGRLVKTKNGVCPNLACGGEGHFVHLGHKVSTDTLLIQFRPPPHITLPSQYKMDFWATLQTALVLGATRALQIERDDIGGTLFPENIDGQDWQRSLVLFDNVPGGAGYMHDIDRHFTKVVEAALSLVRCPYCTPDTSCTRCLRDYGNQAMYPLLKRGEVISFLENLYAHLTQETHPLGVMPLIANNRVEVLWEYISSARRSIRLAVNQVEDIVPAGKTRSWLDLLHDQLRNGVAVQLLLSKPPIPQSSRSSLVEADYLSLMMSKGQQLQLRQVTTLPDWHLIVDAEDDARHRAIQFGEIAPQLGAGLLNPTLRTTTHKEGVRLAVDNFDAAVKTGKSISARDLQPPASTQVYRIQSSSRRTDETQIASIVQFFQFPVVQMSVCDPYLIDYERIVNRLGAYIQLAHNQEALTRVEVVTRDAQLEGKEREMQTHAFEKLRARFSAIDLIVKRRTDRQEHDRWIEIIRKDNSKARMYIGRGLDFIRSDGTVQSTYLVTQEVE
jgi:superfamily II DNA or RNA helicase